jgi:hypothetical protein
MSDQELSALRALWIGFVFQQFFSPSTRRCSQRRQRAAVHLGPPRAAAAASATCLGPGRPDPPSRRPAYPTVRRGKAAGRDRPRRRRCPAGAAGRRAHRQPRLRHRRVHPGPAGGTQHRRHYRVILGASAVTAYAPYPGRDRRHPTEALADGLAAAIIIGAIAGPSPLSAPPASPPPKHSGTSDRTGPRHGSPSQSPKETKIASISLRTAT